MPTVSGGGILLGNQIYIVRRLAFLSDESTKEMSDWLKTIEIPNWFVPVVIAAVLAPAARFLIWGPADVTREWQLEVRKRTKTRFFDITIWWWWFEKERLYTVIDMQDVGEHLIRDWDKTRVDQEVTVLIRDLFELANAAPRGSLERRATRARHAITHFHKLKKDRDFYNEGVVDNAGKAMMKTFARLYRRDWMMQLR